jgi:hypothetical protein
MIIELENYKVQVSMCFYTYVQPRGSKSKAVRSKAKQRGNIQVTKWGSTIANSLTGQGDVNHKGITN